MGWVLRLPSKQTSVYRQVDAIMKTEDIYGGDKYAEDKGYHKHNVMSNCDKVVK